MDAMVKVFLYLGWLFRQPEIMQEDAMLSDLQQNLGALVIYQGSFFWLQNNPCKHTTY
jgi:hypothetical protein